MISEQKDGSLLLSVYVQPGASKSEIVGPHNGSLKIRIHSPPVDGKANEALVQFLAKTLGVSKRSVEVIKGLTQRNKTVKLVGVLLADVKKSLAP